MSLFGCFQLPIHEKKNCHMSMLSMVLMTSHDFLVLTDGFSSINIISLLHASFGQTRSILLYPFPAVSKQESLENMVVTVSFP